MQSTEDRSFAANETRTFPNGRAEILRVGDAEVGRLAIDPGWRSSTDLRPIAGTERCLALHFQYHVTGRARSASTTAGSPR